MKNTEFYTFENEVWYKTSDGCNEQLTENSREVIKDVINKIHTLYPKAYNALCTNYSKCKLNIPFFQFRIVYRFCKCNLGAIDNIHDIDNQSRFCFERISCPLRGECSLENIVCNPEIDTKISPAEMRVLKLVFNGDTHNEIANKLFISEHTVRNHIRNAYTRIGLHEKAEFIDYAHRNKLFKDQ